MSRLWDTPEFWARSEADEVLREMLDAEPGSLADSLERSVASYADGPEMAVLIIAELRRRAAAGVRFWSGPQPIAQVPEAQLAADSRTRETRDIRELINDEIPW